MAATNQQVITTDERSFLSRLRGLGEHIIETVKRFFKKYKERLQFPPHVQESLRNNYREKPQLAVNNKNDETINQLIVDEMKRQFDSQDPGEYLASLDSVKEKEKVILEFAQGVFEIYGLSDIKIVCEYLDQGVAGFYCWGDKSLHLNMSFLSYGNPLLERDIVDTVLHETRHAVQFAAMEGNNPLAFEDSIIRDWVRNANNYIDPSNDPIGYRNQPLEADAWSTAQYNMYTYLESIKG